VRLAHHSRLTGPPVAGWLHHSSSTSGRRRDLHAAARAFSHTAGGACNQDTSHATCCGRRFLRGLGRVSRQLRAGLGRPPAAGPPAVYQTMPAIWPTQCWEVHYVRLFLRSARGSSDVLLNLNRQPLSSTVAVTRRERRAATTLTDAHSWRAGGATHSPPAAPQRAGGNYSDWRTPGGTSAPHHTPTGAPPRSSVTHMTHTLWASCTTRTPGGRSVQGGGVASSTISAGGRTILHLTSLPGRIILHPLCHTAFAVDQATCGHKTAVRKKKKKKKKKNATHRPGIS